MSEDFDLGWLVEGEREDGAQRAAAVDREIRFFETPLRELLAGDERTERGDQASTDSDDPLRSARLTR